MNEALPEIIHGIKQVTDDVRNSFGNLSSEQINWKPSVEGWSVGQCLEHLIKSNEAFEPIMQKLTTGEKRSFWENYSPLTGFFGNFLLKSLKNDGKKFKAPSKDIVPPSDISADIVDKFTKHQEELSKQIESSDSVNWHTTVVTSPFMSLMTYRLGLAFEIAVEHEKRHVRQAKRVMDAEGFPQ